MTGAWLTVSQVQAIPWFAAPSFAALLLVTSAFVTPIVTRGVAARSYTREEAATASEVTEQSAGCQSLMGITITA